MPSGPGTAGDQIHELRLSHLQLREDIVGLRSAILEWPELDRLADNVAELRSGAAEITGLVRYLTARPPVMPSPTASVDLGPVIAGVDHLRSEVDDLRGQVVQLMVLAKKGLVSAPTPDDGSALLLGEIRDLRSQLADVVRSIESQTKESVGLTRAELDELHIVVVRLGASRRPTPSTSASCSTICVAKWWRHATNSPLSARRRRLRHSFPRWSR